MIRALVTCVLFGLSGTALAALDLRLPGGARDLSARVSPLDSYALPTGPYRDGAVPHEMFEGRVDRRTWRMATPGLTTLQVLAPLREQVRESGYRILFDCGETECGGFDFRFATEVVPAPNMYVDIRDFRFLAATGPAGEALTMLVSRSLNAVYLQVIQVLPEGAPQTPPSTQFEGREETSPSPAASPPNGGEGSIAGDLMRAGHAILADLAFDSGATRLSNGNYRSLAELAAHLEANPGLRIALVGHTDSVGPLEQNIALSRQRAESVRERLVDVYGIALERVEAQGMGYLAPIASNLTPEGREANRRVEVILLSDG
jgi:OOP family OmpA-OmpF porin